MHNVSTKEWESPGRFGVAFGSGKPASEEARDALFQYYHLVFHAGLQRFSLQ